MARVVWGMIGCYGLALSGCAKPADRPAKVPTPTAVASTVSSEGDATPAAGNDQPDSISLIAEHAPADRPIPENGLTPAELDGSTGLKLDGICFVVPAGWKQVRPQTYIVEAEFELPRVDGNAYDGRLTLMSSGGDPQEIIANRAAEFVQNADDRPTVETMRIADVDATWLDVRGQWKGPTFRPIDPRDDYRMILVIIPFTAHSAFYVKLTGPRELIAAREFEFLQFVQSARFTPLDEK
jgi:hypothetical protein